MRGSENIPRDESRDSSKSSLASLGSPNESVKPTIYVVDSEVIKIPNAVNAIELDILQHVKFPSLLSCNRIHHTMNAISIYTDRYENLMDLSPTISSPSSPSSLHDWNFIVQIMFDVGQALRHLHAHGFAHNDITMSNVMYDSKRKHAVLIDMGNASVIDPLRPILADDIMPVYYRAPETYDGRIVLNAATDTWCFGLFCLALGTKCASEFIVKHAHDQRIALLRQHKLSSSEHRHYYLKTIKQGLMRIGFNNTSLYPPQFVSFINAVLQPKETRMSLNELLQSPLFMNAKLLTSDSMNSIHINHAKSEISNRAEVISAVTRYLSPISTAMVFHTIDILDRFYILIGRSDKVEYTEYKRDIAAVAYLLNTYYPIPLRFKVDVTYAREILIMFIDAGMPLWRPTKYDVISGTIPTNARAAFDIDAALKELN